MQPPKPWPPLNRWQRIPPFPQINRQRALIGPDNRIKAFPPTPIPANPSFAVYSGTTSNAAAGFANTSYRLFDRLTIGAGARYFKDNESNYQGPPTTTQSQSFSSVDPRVYLKYDLTGDMNVYASAAKGFRSGGFNSEGQPTYGPESVWTYEVGSKASMLERRLSPHYRRLDFEAMPDHVMRDLGFLDGNDPRYEDERWR